MAQTRDQSPQGLRLPSAERGMGRSQGFPCSYLSLSYRAGDWDVLGTRPGVTGFQLSDLFHDVSGGSQGSGWVKLWTRLWP